MYVVIELLPQTGIALSIFPSLDIQMSGIARVIVFSYYSCKRKNKLLLLLIGARPTYCPDPDVLGEPRTERNWVKGGESQGAVLNLDDHIG